MCAATFDLCYSLEAVIVECDESKRITDKIWRPKSEQLITDPEIVGESWKWEPNTKDVPCYFTALKAKRVDKKERLLYYPVLNKRIVVADPMKPPFMWPMLDNLYVEAGTSKEFVFANATDPDGFDVIMLFKLGRASKFAYWEPNNLTLIIEEGKTQKRRDEGDYVLLLQLI